MFSPQEDLLVNLLKKNRAQAMGVEDPDTAVKVKL